MCIGLRNGIRNHKLLIELARENAALISRDNMSLRFLPFFVLGLVAIVRRGRVSLLRTMINQYKD